MGSIGGRSAAGPRSASPGPAPRRSRPGRGGPGRARRGSTGRSPPRSRRRGPGRPGRAARQAGPRRGPSRRGATGGRRSPGSATRRVRRTRRSGGARPPAPPRPTGPGSRRRRYGLASGSTRVRAVSWLTSSASREVLGARERVEQGDLPAQRRSEGDERAGDRRRAGDPQERRGEMRFHVDLQGATGMAGHDELDDAVAAAALGRCVLRQPEEPRLPVGHRVERLADDDGLGAAAADPALDRAVGMDDAARPGPSRRRTGHGHDGRGDERAAGRFELGRPGEDAAGHDRACSETPAAPS